MYVHVLNVIDIPFTFIFGFYVFFEPLPANLYHTIPGGNPPRDWQSLP
jgi:hypothetical protein